LMTSSISGDCFFTEMPRRVTSDGRRELARATRFCTSTVARSRSRAMSKVTFKTMRPSLELTELM